MDKNCCEEKKIDLSDGISREELGIFVLVGAFIVTLLFGFYKAIVAGDFPNNMTDFLTMLAFAIGVREALPQVAGKVRR